MLFKNVQFPFLIISALFQTPSERIKAKIKLMLEKSSAGAADQPQVYTPTPSQLAGIESDTFESVSFSATRTSGQKEVVSFSLDYGIM